MGSRPKRILIIYDYREDSEKMRLTIKHHLRVLESSDSKHEIVYFNTFDDVPSWILDGTPAVPPSWLHHNSFEIVILHYSFFSLRYTGNFFYKWKRHFSWIKELDCLKIAIPQDEFDRAALLDEWLFEWNVPIVFSVQHADKGPLYPIMSDKAHFYRCLPGYIDETAARQIAGDMSPTAERPYDIVYRARNLPYRIGSVGQLKHRIADIVLSHAQAHDLRCDISTRAEDAILGDRWLDFIASGKAVIGCEGGSSVIDWRGEIEAQIEALLTKDRSLSFEDVSARMSKGWDEYRFLTITPRHFEAVITKTCQILVEGEYRGILEPDKHYIPLKRDFSNLDEALEKLRDDRYVQDMVERAYQDIYLSGKYTYGAFAKQIEQAILDNQHKIYESERYEKPMAKHDDCLEVLERQLITERHRSALMEAQLLEAKEEIERMRGKLAALEVEHQALEAEYQARETKQQGERKSWLRLTVVTILMAVAMGALISVGALMLLTKLRAG